MSSKHTLLASVFVMTAIGASYASAANSFIPAASYQVADIRDVVHDNGDGSVVRSTSGECVRTKTMTNADECAPAVVAVQQPPIVQHQVRQISREERTVYSGFNQSKLTPEMKEKLSSLATNLKADEHVRGVRIVGYADRIGNPNYNEQLSKKRAEVVQNYLVNQGIINASVADTRWVGSSDPTANCPDTLSRTDLINCLQQDRRVEVEIDYAPTTEASR